MRGLRVLLIAVCLPACHGGSGREIVSPPAGVEPAQPLAVEISWSRDVWPILDCGLYPIKRTVGERVEVWADVLRDGHEQLGAAIRYRRTGARRWQGAPMHAVENDRWTGTFEVDEPGRWQFTVLAWVDRFASWRDELRRKVDAGQEDV